MLYCSVYKVTILLLLKKLSNYLQLLPIKIILNSSSQELLNLLHYQLIKHKKRISSKKESISSKNSHQTDKYFSEE